MQPEGDITVEFAEWAGRSGLTVTDDNYYSLWERFLDEEYNDQRNWPPHEV
jgi:hypothetical protein